MISLSISLIDYCHISVVAHICCGIVLNILRNFVFNSYRMYIAFISMYSKFCLHLLISVYTGTVLCKLLPGDTMLVLYMLESSRVAPQRFQILGGLKKIPVFLPITCHISERYRIVSDDY